MGGLKKVFFLNDGGYDDFAALPALLQADVDLVGISVLNGNCYVRLALPAQAQMVKRWKRSDNDHIVVAGSSAKGDPNHQFPAEWRADSYAAWTWLRGEEWPIFPEPGHKALLHVLRNSKEPVEIISTGPLSDLTMALQEDPSVKSKISRVVWHTREPVEEWVPGVGRSWNVQWDLESSLYFWDSVHDVPVVLVAQGAKVTAELRERLKAQLQWPALAFASLMVEVELAGGVSETRLALWDPVTVVCALYPEVAQWETVGVKLASDGVMVVDASARQVQRSTEINIDLFWERYEALMKRATPVVREG